MAGERVRRGFDPSDAPRAHWSAKVGTGGGGVSRVRADAFATNHQGSSEMREIMLSAGVGTFQKSDRLPFGATVLVWLWARNGH